MNGIRSAVHGALLAVVIAVPAIAQAPIAPLFQKPATPKDGFVIESARGVPQSPAQPVLVTQHQPVMIFGDMVSHVGTKDTKAAPLKGLGRRLPFVMVLRQVVPDGWSAFQDAGAKFPQTASWRGGKPWYEVLDEVIASVNETPGASQITAEVDWNKRQVTIRKGAERAEPVKAASPPVAPQPALHFQQQTNAASGAFAGMPPAGNAAQAAWIASQVAAAQAQASGQRPQAPAGQLPAGAQMPPNFAPAAAPAAPASQSVIDAKNDRFQLDPKDGTLKTSVKRWADAVSWRLVWDASDYRFNVNTVFSGDFEAAVCAVLRGVNNANAADPKLRTTQKPLDAMFFIGSKTVRVFDARSDTETGIEATGGRCFPKGGN